MTTASPAPLRRRRWHPVTIAGCLGTLAALSALIVLRQQGHGWLLWTMLGASAGFSTSGSV